MDKKLRGVTGGHNVPKKPEEYKKKDLEVPKKIPPKEEKK